MVTIIVILVVRRSCRSSSVFCQVCTDISASIYTAAMHRTAYLYTVNPPPLPPNVSRIPHPRTSVLVDFFSSQKQNGILHVYYFLSCQKQLPHFCFWFTWWEFWFIRLSVRLTVIQNTSIELLYHQILSITRLHSRPSCSKLKSVIQKYLI